MPSDHFSLPYCSSIRSRGRSRGFSRAFSLTELLVVVFIIAVIIALVVPALTGARNAANRLATTNLLNQINTAAQAFRGDHQGQIPGYFPLRDLGSDLNADAGLTAMENMMLDLSCGSALRGLNDIPSGDQASWAKVHWDPGASDEEAIYVNPSLIGSDQKEYFAPPTEVLQAQFQSDGRQYSDGALENTAAEGRVQMPDLVDRWGQPLLAWVADTVSAPVISDPSLFARESSDDGPARYYWNTNAGYLRAESYGELGAGMTLEPDSSAYSSGLSPSLIGEGALNALGTDEGVSAMMAAFLGGPAYPADGTLTDGNPYLDPYPTQGRGEIIIQSAGPDGVPFSGRDRAVRVFGTGDINGSNAFDLRYGINFATPDGVRRAEDGRNVVIDFASEFDDLIVATE